MAPHSHPFQEMTGMKITILESCYVAGEVKTLGETFDCDQKTAQLLINLGRAEPALVPPPADPAE
jgi:hypothetical protein